jgi:uncharacterized protein YxjI
MATFEITQRLMAVASQYDVKVGTEAEPSLRVQGTFLTSTPNLTLFDGEKAVATLKGNMMKTKFIVAAEGAEKAVVNFPTVSLRKTMTLTFGGRGYHATSGGVSTEIFQCADNDGNVALELRKEVGWRDRFKVECKDDLPREIAILTAVAIHSRYYE